MTKNRQEYDSCHREPNEVRCPEKVTYKGTRYQCQWGTGHTGKHCAVVLEYVEVGWRSEKKIGKAPRKKAGGNSECTNRGGTSTKPIDVLKEAGAGGTL